MALALCLFGQDAENIRLRGRLDNCRARFERDKKGHVVFMGGSITEMEGYRPMVMDLLRRRFPATGFDFTNAGISSTCSTTGAFRLETDVLGKGPVDLLFVEFAVNDDQDAGHSRQNCIRGMEGIVRHVRRHNPRADIVITYFVNPEMLETLRAGKTPLTVGSHEEVAERYGVSSLHLGREVARRIEAGTMTWKEYGGVHPSKAGNSVAAGMVGTLLDRAWGGPLPADFKPAPHPVPEPLDPLNYERGRFLDPSLAKVRDGWTLGVPDWKNIPGAMRDRFKNVPMVCGSLGKSLELKLEFEGTCIGAYVLAGPDAGMAHLYVDGVEQKRVSLYHRFSKGLHYPRTVLFATDLKPGKHTLELWVAGETFSEGFSIRIMQFVAN